MNMVALRSFDDKSVSGNAQSVALSHKPIPFNKENPNILLDLVILTVSDMLNNDINLDKNLFDIESLLYR